MTEKLLLEKERSHLRANYLANQTFQIGQGLLTDINGRRHDVDDRKLQTIQKTKTRQANHIEYVNATLEQSLLNEDERVEKAMFKTEEAKLTFLQRL